MPGPLNSTIREQIIAAVVAALKAAQTPDGFAPPANLVISRESTRALETDSLPAIFVYFEDDAPKPFDAQKFRSPFAERSLALAMDCRAAASQTTPADQALDPVIAWAFKAGFADETFDGLALGAEEGKTTWKSREGDMAVAAATIRFSIRYRTSRLDPTKHPTNS